jgi:hypothetical protein
VGASHRHTEIGRCGRAHWTGHAKIRGVRAGIPIHQARHEHNGDSGEKSPRVAPPYSWTPRIPTTMPLISEIRPRHHTPALLGTGVPFVL